MISMSDWSEATVARFSKSMRERRLALGLSAQQLADKTKEAGHPINRSSIAGWENGTRGDRLMISDALVLAYILGMPLGLMVYPNQPDGEVDVAPGVPVDAFSALGWLTGEVIPHDTVDPEEMELLGNGTQLYSLAHQISGMRDNLNAYRDDYRTAIASGDSELASQLRSMMTHTSNMLESVVAEIRSIGGEVNE